MAYCQMLDIAKGTKEDVWDKQRKEPSGDLCFVLRPRSIKCAIEQISR